MPQVKQLIERNLKFTNKYVYLEIIRGSIESGQVCSCDNCGKLITNMVKIANKETKQIHYIGTDCMETLAKAKCVYNNGSATDYRIDLYSYNLTARFVTEINKGKKYIDYGFKLEITKDNDKVIQCFKSDLLLYFPTHIQSTN
jgi:acyl-CoA hydrolase